MTEPTLYEMVGAVLLVAGGSMVIVSAGALLTVTLLDVRAVRRRAAKMRQAGER